ncbi:MAG: hypothetical protein ED557_11365 [Balneola sp.]|nr:MAG: hypothetical protein ED557_11365 [Balneola sp.]
MKRFTILTLSMLAISMLSFGQTPEIDIDEAIRGYAKVSKYAGTWISIEGDDTLIVNLELGTFYQKRFNKDIPVLFGTYTYSLSSSKQLAMVAVEEGEFTLNNGLLVGRDSRPSINFSYKDTETGRPSRLRLYVDESDENILYWHIVKTTRWIINGEARYPAGYSVPENLTLVRVDSD